MKSPEIARCCITPEAEGWSVWQDGRRCEIVPDLEAAVRLIPSTVPFDFAAPAHPLILERLRLPMAERDDLAGMVQLQWEKALPYAPEEITGDFLVVATDDEGATVWSAATSQEALQPYGEAWTHSRRWPERTAPFVCHVAAACPAGEAVLVVYAEQSHWVLAVVENGRPGWVHVLSSVDAAGLSAEFPALMLTAGLDGVPQSFTRVLIGSEIDEAQEFLASATGAAVERLPAIAPSDSVEMNLTTEVWRGASVRSREGKAWRQRLIAAGVVYLAVLAAAGVDIFILQRRAASIDAELAGMRPALAQMQIQQNRYNALAPAISPPQYTVELLYRLQRCLPADTVTFTEFEQMPQQWRVVGEAPSASLATDYLGRLKHDPDLGGNDITADPPRLLANQHAQFQVIGKP